MKDLFKYYILAFLLLSDFVMFAQVDPADEDDGTGGGVGGLEGGDPVPIDGKLIFLAIVGVFYVLYTYRKKNKKIA
jgi:hypothetical protein